MLPIQSVLDIFPRRVQVIYDYISIARMACCEDHYLKIFVQIFQDFERIGTNIYGSSGYLSIGELDGEFDIARAVGVVVAVDESFVKIKNYCLLIYG